jgi:hypothetical protein
MCSGADGERPWRVPALAGKCPALTLLPVGEDGPVAVEQLPRREQLVAVLGAREREPCLDRLSSNPEARRT